MSMFASLSAKLAPRPFRSALDSSRLDTARAEAMHTVGQVMGLLGLSGLPFTAFWAFGGQGAPLAANLMLLAGTALSLVAERRGPRDHAVMMQVMGLVFAGLAVSIAEAEVSGFGLALALLGPVHAALVGARSRVTRLSWALLLPVVVAGALSHFGLLLDPVADRTVLQVFAGLTFVVIAATVALMATRLSAVFEVFERGQLNAYRHLVDQMQETMVRYGEDGQLIYVSSAAEGLFGCQRFEVTEVTLVERVHLQDRPLFLATLDAAANGGESRTVELRMRRDVPGARLPDYVYVEVASASVSSGPRAESARFEVVLLIRDISARREREAELRKAWRAAEEASEAKSRFLATMGHELRTPLNAVLGFSDMLASGVSGDLSAQQLDYARMIQQSGKHMGGLITTLLDMSRLEAGKFELATDAFAPDSVVEPVFRMMDPLASERRVKLAFDCPRPMPLLVADERACRQILINLVSNAIKFSHPEGVVSVGLKKQGRHVAFTITDQGIGMDSETLKRLGEPFFQAQDGLARHYEGSGLGLSIVKGLVDLHDGTMSVRSSPGEGTSVTILLPINGPETKISDTDNVTPIRPDGVTPLVQWPDARKSAR
jgi:cell cycle sensor histidine kinase DivJ